METVVQPLYLTKVKLLSQKQIFLGLSNQILSGLAEKSGKGFDATLRAYHKTFNVIEWKTDVKTLVDATTMQTLSNIGFESIFIRLECNANFFYENGTIVSDQWQHFISIILDQDAGRKYNIVLCLERFVQYDEEIVEAFIKLREDIYPIGLLLEIQNHSWKNPPAIKLFRGEKINVVQKDMPNLSGFNFKINNYDSKKCYLRLLGRNQRNWFSNEAKVRHQYDYSKVELMQIGEEIQKIKDQHEKVYVIAANAPAETALANIIELAYIYPID